MTLDRRTAAATTVADFLDGNVLPISDPTPCPYLPGRMARSEGFTVQQPIDEAIYGALMDRGFRRSGEVFYRPRCVGCRRCIPLRVPVRQFAPSRSLRRVQARNADLSVSIEPAECTDEKHALFARYLEEQHDGAMSGDRADFEAFLYAPVVERIDICYRAGNRLVGVSMADRVPAALSSVYMCFDPAERHRSLGTFSVLWEIDHCRARGLEYYYLGYYVPGSPKMDYKARFQPSEILDANGRWIPFDPNASENTE